MKTLVDLDIKSALPQQAATSTVTGAAVDMQAYGLNTHYVKGILFCLPTGADAGETCDVKFQESPTTSSGDFVDIPGAAFPQVVQPGVTPVLLQIHFPIKKRYIRVIAALAGTTPAFTVGAAIALQKLQ